MSATRELPDPLVGTVVAGRYRIVRRLAAGGMGVVYEATQEPLGRRVAVKVIRGDAVHDPVARLRFEREAKTASSLQEPHVVVIHDFGVLDDGGTVGGSGGGLFLAMEYVEGETLRERLSAAGRLPWKQSRVVVEHIARALAAAHGKGLVHRDLKPENVMLVPTSGDGGDSRGHGGTFCKVLDFGLAKGIDDRLLPNAGGGNQLTRSGGFVGTPGYISPEHIDGASEDPRQDIYALGVVWWEMLTGRHPFPAETPMKTLLRQMHEEPPPLDDVLRLAEGIPPAGAQLVRDMMARAPQSRPKDGGAVLARLMLLDVAPGTESGRVIDSNAPTLAGMTRPRSPIDTRGDPLIHAAGDPASLATKLSPPGGAPTTGIDNLQLLHSPGWVASPLLSSSSASSASSSPASSNPSGAPSGVLTVDGRAPGAASAMSAVAQPTPITAPHAPINPSSLSALSSAGSRSGPRRRHRLLGLLLGCSLIGTAGGVVVVKLLDEGPPLEPVPEPLPEPLRVETHVPVTTRVLIEGLSSFTALKAARTSLPPHTLRVYRPNHSELLFDDDVAATVADLLQGRVIEGGGASFVLEVLELDRGRVIVSATSMVDAGVVLDGDAGVDVLDMLDGGVVPGLLVPGDAGSAVVAPDGLEP